jgi:hypothetical protein
MRRDVRCLPSALRVPCTDAKTSRRLGGDRLRFHNFLRRIARLSATNLSARCLRATTDKKPPKRQSNN